MELWAPIISCIGSIVAALIAATSSVIIARMQKEKTSAKDGQYQDVQSTPVTHSTKAESIAPENEDKTATVLGITSIITGVLVLCTSLPSILFSFPAIILGITAIVSKKKWAGVTGLVLNGVGIIVTIIFYIVIFSMQSNPTP